MIFNMVQENLHFHNEFQKHEVSSYAHDLSLLVVLHYLHVS